MRRNGKPEMNSNQASLCIICCLAKELTDEHIVPEFLGGGLLFRRVCRDCNSKMGSGFEGRLSNNIAYKSFRFSNNIHGKSTAPFPFEGGHKDTISGTKFQILKDGSLKSHPHCEIEEDENGLRIEIKVDAEDRGNIPKIIEKKLIRHFKKTGKNIDQEKLSKLVAEVIASHELKEDKLTNPKIEVSGFFDLNDVDLLHIKVAYELAGFHFGDIYFEDAIANELRLCLFNQKIPPQINIETPASMAALENIIDKQRHWVIFWSSFCYVNICGFSSAIEFASKEFGRKAPKGILYEFCYQTQSYKVYDLANYIKDELIKKRHGGRV